MPNANASTADFRRTMEEASGRDLDWFFDQWLHRGGALEVEGAWSWDAERGVLRVELDQIQPNGLPYRTPIELLIGDTEGAEHIETLELDAMHQEYEIEMDVTPTSVTPDPRLKLLASWQLGHR